MPGSNHQNSISSLILAFLTVFSCHILLLSEEQRRLEKRRSLESTVLHGPVRQSMKGSAGDQAYGEASRSMHALAAVSKSNSSGLLGCAKHAGVSTICNRHVVYNHICTWRYLPEETVLQHLWSCCHLGQGLLLLATNCLPEKGVSVNLLPLICVC